MNLNWPILSVVTFLPLFGAVLIMAMVRGNERFARGTARWISLWTTLVTLAFSLVMVWRFDASCAGIPVCKEIQLARHCLLSHGR